MHFLLIMLLLLFDKGDFEQEKFVINQNKSVSTIVFMPLNKRMPDKSGKSVSGTSDKAHTMSYDAYQKALERRKKSHKSTSKSAAKSGKKFQPSRKATADTAGKPKVKAAPIAPAEKVKALTTLRQEKSKAVVVKPISKKTVAPKKVAKVVKPVVKAQPKKALTQSSSAKALADTKEKVAAAKALAQKQLADKKALEKKDRKEEEAKAEKIAEQEKIEADKKVEQIEEQQEVVSTVQPEESVAEIKSDDEDDSDDISGNDDEDDIDIDLDNVIFAGRDDMEKREIEGSIKKEILKYWKCPVGIAKTTKCEFVVLVGVDGKVLRVDIKKPSGSLAYNISGRAAIYQSRFQKEVWGKEFIIVLGAS